LRLHGIVYETVHSRHDTERRTALLDAISAVRDAHPLVKHVKVARQRLSDHALAGFGEGPLGHGLWRAEHVEVALLDAISAVRDAHPLVKQFVDFHVLGAPQTMSESVQSRTRARQGRARP
jgi:hypothetical protein